MKQQQRQLNSGSELKIGDVVRFDTKTKGIKFIRIEKFNRARTCVVGYECDANGENKKTMHWTVANTLCKAVVK